MSAALSFLEPRDDPPRRPTTPEHTSTSANQSRGETRIRSDARSSIRQDGLFGSVCSPASLAPAASLLLLLLPPCTPLFLLGALPIPLRLFTASRSLSLTRLAYRLYQSLSLQDKSPSFETLTRRWSAFGSSLPSP